MSELADARGSISRHKDINYIPWHLLIIAAQERKTSRKQKNRDRKG
jgi:hypothetical protein